MYSPSRAEIGESGFSRYDVPVPPSSASTWEDRVKVDDFNCVFQAAKRGRRTLQVGRVSDTSIPLSRLKTVGGTECVSSDMQQKHVVSMWTCA